MLNFLKSQFKESRRRQIIWLVIISAAIIMLANIPYLVGYLSQNDEYVYAGVSVAPEDNLSYQAKIGQGIRGNWLFHLPYTASSHQRVPIYLFYIFLGHLSRIFNLTNVFSLHISRLVNGFILLFMLYKTATLSGGVL